MFGSRSSTFQRQFKVFSGAFLNRPELDEGGKIILPPSALEELSRKNIMYPMIFCLTNQKNGRKTHCGVLEFVAEEGRAYVPHWMLEQLCTDAGSILVIESATLPKGSYCKLRPQRTSFIELSDPRAVLEMKLRNFSALTKGDTIAINYDQQQFFIDVVDVGIGGQTEQTRRLIDAVCIVETDVVVDFDAPVDHVERKVSEPSPVEDQLSSVQFGSKRLKVEEPASTSSETKREEDTEKPPSREAPAFVPFGGVGKRLDGQSKPGSGSTVNIGASSSALPGRRLDGKPVVGRTGTMSTAVPEQPPNSDDNNERAPPPVAPALGRSGGRMAFGGASLGPAHTTSLSGKARAVDRSESSAGAPKPFGGTGRSLK